MSLATPPLARFVEAAGQLRAAWYDAKAYFSENLSEGALGSDQLHKFDSAEELIDEAVSNAESTLKACAKLCQVTKSIPQPPPVRSSWDDDTRGEKKERPWAAASQQSRRAGKRTYEDTDSDWPSWKRPQQNKWKETPPPPPAVAKHLLPQTKRLLDEGTIKNSFDTYRPQNASEWAQLRRVERQATIDATWFPGKITSEDLYRNVLPTRLPTLPQDRLCDLLAECIEKWLKKRNAKKYGNQDEVTERLDGVWGSDKFKIIYPLIDPPIDSLGDWVSDHMHDTTVGEDEKGNTTVTRRRIDEDDEVEKELYQEKLTEFLESLPEDRLTDEEENLHMALLNFLEKWTGDSPPKVEEAYNPNTEEAMEVYMCMWAFVPRRIKLRDWIMNRVGEEFEVLENEAGSFVFQLPSAQKGEFDCADVGE